MSFMSVNINAPFTVGQVDAIQRYQDGPEPITCRNEHCHGDLANAPALIASTAGLTCPDINCASVVTSVSEHVIAGRFRF